MAYNEQFIVYGRKSAFDADLTAGNLKETSIVFIEDTHQIWTQGTLYSCPFTADEIQEFLNSKVDKVTGKSLVADELITKLTALKTQAEITADINAIGNYTVNGKKISTNPTLAKADIGLGNVDNTSDVTKPVSTAQAAAIADAKKAGTDAQADIDEHLENDTPGLNHIPAGGHERQILAWEADGRAKWDDLANMFTGLEELLAYGVEWDVTVADPHLTRIGNMSLHKTLPIQSQLKGCIAQVDKVIYWLDENDWRFRKDPKTITVDLTNNTDTFVVDSVEGLGVGQYLRNDQRIAKITAIDVEALTLTVEWEWSESEEELPDLTTITSLEVGSRLDGYDGTVRVYCPNFYIKSQIIGNKRRVWLSTAKIDNTWTYQHEILIDAYRSTVLNTVPENMGYLSTLPVNSAISVVNTADYCRGGNNNASYDKYLDTDPIRTQLGKPRTYISRATTRTYARNAGSEMLSYEQYKNIFYWLWVVEYANFNSQEEYNAELTSEGYHQGGMGPGVTTWNSTHWSNYNGYYPLTPCGYTNEFGNGTGVKPFTTVAGTNNLDAGETAIPEVTSVVPRWRGFENPFGDIWTNLDGVLIDTPLAGASDTSILPTCYVITDPNNYTDSLAGIEEKAVRAVKQAHNSGYTKEQNLGDSADMIPESVGGGNTTWKCDYYWVNYDDDTPETLFVGGRAYEGSRAGLGFFNSDLGVSVSWEYVGFRSVSSFLSFQDNQ